MIKKLPVSGSLRAKFVLLALLGLLLGGLLWLLLTGLGSRMIDVVYMDLEHVARRKGRIYTEFSRYVESEGIAGRDAAAVARWTASHDYVTIYLFGGDRLQQRYADGKLISGSALPYDPAVHGRLYPVRFADGTYSIAILDSSQLRQKHLVNIAAFVAAGTAFLLLILWYTDRLTRRIIALSREAEKVSSGDPEMQLTVVGDDELSRLAASMEEMRRSVIDRVSREKRAWEANAELITAISHDIRTPMTSMIGYLELLTGEALDEETRRQFSRSAYTKAMELKDLTDQLFRYFLVYGKAELELNLERFDGRLLLEQLLSEAEFDLLEAGFSIQRIEFEGECSLMADPLYLKRVIDNLVSNIKKYADPSEALVTLSELGEKELRLSMSNAVSPTLSHKDSTRIGLRTCEKIMEAMGGSFSTRSDGEHFLAELSLPAQEVVLPASQT